MNDLPGWVQRHVHPAYWQYWNGNESVPMRLRQIDALIAEELMGWERRYHDRYGGDVVNDYLWHSPDGIMWQYEPPRFMSDANATMRLFEKMIEEGWLPSLEYERGRWVSHMGHYVYDAGYAVHDSPLVAACVAALDAYGIKVMPLD